MHQQVSNVDLEVVQDFGDEWTRHDQSGVPKAELRGLFEQYFSLFPWDALPQKAEGFDLGCGSGRWADFVAPRVGRLHCIDPSAEALKVARQKLAHHDNCDFHLADSGAIPFPDESMDFGYSLGVLHHLPDTEDGIRNCVRKLKRGAPMLLYLYYAFDNRPTWFKATWKASDVLRRAICRLPARPKALVTDVLALTVYWPLSRLCRLVEALGIDPAGLPLAAYRDKSIATLRTDSRDRFGTRLEHRFTRAQIAGMMRRAGLERIEFRDGSPFWCSIGYKA